MTIHPTAIIDPAAILSPSVQVGPYSVIGADVEIAANTIIENHVTIQGPTKIGSNCLIYPYAAIGLATQDKKFKGEPARLVIGDHNIIRESVTINRGTKEGDFGTDHGNGETLIGHHNLIMALSHVAHDCIIGDYNTLTNGTALGGHVILGNHIVTGGYTAIHQFCKIGDYVFTGAQSMLTQDVLPYLSAVGNRAQITGINKTGLERNGFSEEVIRTIEKAYKIFFRQNLAKNEAIKTLQEIFPDSLEIQKFIRFALESQRGLCR